MSVGRFRVKSGVDWSTAEVLMRDLVSLGAVCMIVDDGGQVVARGPEHRAHSRSAERSVATRESSGQASASYSDEHDDGPVMNTVMIVDRPPARSSHDVQDQAGQAQRSVSTPEMASHMAPMFEHEPKPSEPRSEPEHIARRGVSLARGPLNRARTKLADVLRLRFAVGVFVVLLLGFLPALIFAQVRASSLDDIDRELRAEQAHVSDIDDWHRLDDIRASMLQRKRSQRSRIAIGGIAIWVLSSTGLAFFWFRKIDWEFYQTHPSS